MLEGRTVWCCGICDTGHWLKEDADKCCTEIKAENFFNEVFNSNMKHVKCGEERIYFSKQYLLSMKKKHFYLTKEEEKELNEFTKNGDNR